MPVRFLQVEYEVRTKTVVKCVVGLAAMIISIIAFILLAITIVLLPLALVLGGLVLISLLLANLFVASGLGRIIFGYYEVEWKRMANLYPWISGALYSLYHSHNQYHHVCYQFQPRFWGCPVCYQE